MIKVKERKTDENGHMILIGTDDQGRKVQYNYDLKRRVRETQQDTGFWDEFKIDDATQYLQEQEEG